MFKFDKKQEVFDVGGVKFGGQPGEYPTVLIGTMFYNRHKIVTNEDTGEFDKGAADSLWNDMQEMGDVTGNPYVNQIVGETPEAIKKFIDWFSVHEDEIEAITRSGMDAAIVLAFNATDPSVKGKLEILEVGGTGQDKGMLEIAKECGITKPLIDVAATPLGAGAGATIRAVTTVKGHLGLPVGAGYHNMASAWDWMKTFKKTHKDAYMPADIGTNLVAQIMGSNFQLFGPIENATTVFPATAMVDIILAETAKELGIAIADEENHPISKLV
jgi:tetrahydromethanopterin S-methyltransferase subunit H